MAPHAESAGRATQGGGGAGTADRIIVVQNWFEELKRLVPVQ